MTKQEIEKLAETDLEQALQEAINALENNPKTSEMVFEGYGCFFIVLDGEIRTISDDASCSPKGRWFPEIVTGPSQGEQDEIQEIAYEFEVEDSAYYDAFTDGSFYGDKSNDTFIKYFEDRDDEDTVKELKKLINALKNTQWTQVSDFLKAIRLVGLDEGRMYYDWKGEWIDFYDNVMDFGEERGENEEMTDEEWLKCILPEIIE